MSWKQPIPTDLEEEFGDDVQAFVMFVILLLRASNSDKVVMVGKKLVKLDRGQSVFGRKSCAKYIGASEKTAERCLQRLVTLHNKLTITPTKNFTLVTILNYDSLTKFDQQATNKRPTSDQQATTNKSVKSDKSVKKIARDLPPSLKEDELEEITELCSQKSGVPLTPQFQAFVRSKYDDMLTWYHEQPHARNRKGRNWRLTLISWVKRDALKIKSQQYGNKKGIDASNI